MVATGGEVTTGSPTTGELVPLTVKQRAVYEIDPFGFSVVSLPTTGGGPELARSLAGTYLDAETRRFYVAGGLGVEGPRGDLWQLDLASGSWVELSAGATEGPAGVIAPLVGRDPVTGTMWVADARPEYTTGSIPLWSLSRLGVWSESTASSPDVEPSWPVQETFFNDRGYTYPWFVEADAPWPGQYVLATLMASEPVLALGLETVTGIPLGVASETGMSEVVAGALCPSGSTCFVRVQARPGAAYRDGLPFSLTAASAELLEEQDLQQAGEITALELWKGLVLVGTKRGLRVYQEGSPPDPLAELSFAGNDEVTGMARCGSALCLSRKRKVGGLVVVDLTDPAHPVAVGTAALSGLGHDVAAVGRTVYVAEDGDGIGLFDVSPPGNPRPVGRLQPGERIRALAASPTLLAAAGEHQTVYLYDLADGGQSVGQLTATRKVSRMRLIGSQLWLLDQQERVVEGFDVRIPAQPQRLGDFSSEAARSFGRRVGGDLAYTFEGRHLVIERLVALP